MRRERENIMLCYPATEKRVASFKQPFFWQPKLNGERCRVEWFKDEPILLSAFGIQYKFLPHIEQALKKLPQLAYDGELYRHGWSRERIHSAASRKVNENEDSKELQFHIFDIQKNDLSEQWERVEVLAQIKLESPLFLVPTGLATSETWMQCCVECTEEGYEGIILRDPHGLYQMKRSTQVAKFKPTYKDEYLIHDVKEAIDKYGNPKGMVGAFCVKSPYSHSIFEVGAGKLTHNERIALWQIHCESDGIAGKRLVVKHEAISTINGVPLCNVALEVK